MLLKMILTRAGLTIRQTRPEAYETLNPGLILTLQFFFIGI